MKKNLIILVAVLLTSTLSFAQSGKMFVTGQLGFNTNSATNTFAGTSVDVPASNTFDIMAEFHYKVTNEIAVGLGVNYNRSSSYDGTTLAGKDYFDTRSMFSIVPSAIYGVKITENFTYIPRLYIDFGFGSYDNESDILGQIATNTSDLSSIAIGVRPLSFEYGINKRLAITMSFGDIHYRIDTEKGTIGGTAFETANKSFALDANYGAAFGLRLYL
ncbi:MAG: outer membrane beta-barrel protein [Bacteroidales bacterium]|nr:outer membrane beta-barrel protein [Bacteroidales bacterium]MDD4685511.1 outer membrane beta-barrel protein [Bacteroidales bacterium]